MIALVHIQNLKCGGCATTIINKLSALKNISEVEVNHNESIVSFDYHTNHDFEKATDLLSVIGYPVVGAKNKFITKVMSYASCASGRVHKKK